jgi:hypothetical protein
MSKDYGEKSPLPGPIPKSVRTVDGIPLGQFALRMLWVAARIVAVAYLGHSGATFFYQGF